MCWELQCVAICRVLLYVALSCYMLLILTRLGTDGDHQLPHYNFFLCVLLWVAVCCCVLLYVAVCCLDLPILVQMVTMWQCFLLLMSFLFQLGLLSRYCDHFPQCLHIFPGRCLFSRVLTISLDLPYAFETSLTLYGEPPLGVALLDANFRCFRWNGMVSRTFRVTGWLKRHVYLYKV